MPTVNGTLSHCSEYTQSSDPEPTQNAHTLNSPQCLSNENTLTDKARQNQDSYVTEGNTGGSKSDNSTGSSDEQMRLFLPDNPLCSDQG